jgi:predicted RNA-binding Zn-ribbon protein involved in translation (DUF1610 family)
MSIVYEDNGVYRISPIESVRLFFDNVVPFFQCLACEELLDVNEETKRFCCPGCSLEMDVSEARSICDIYIAVIGGMVPKLKKQGKIKWLWAKLFGGSSQNSKLLKP